MSESDATSAKPVTAMDKLFGTMLEPASSSSSNNLVAALESIRDEISRFRKQNCAINTDPLQWWKVNCSMYPRLSQFAKQRLTVSGTSVPSERIFSKAGQLVSAKRACLSSRNVDTLIFLNKNLGML